MDLEVAAVRVIRSFFGAEPELSDSQLTRFATALESSDSTFPFPIVAAGACAELLLDRSEQAADLCRPFGGSEPGSLNGSELGLSEGRQLGLSEGSEPRTLGDSELAQREDTTPMSAGDQSLVLGDWPQTPRDLSMAWGIVAHALLLDSDIAGAQRAAKRALRFAGEDQNSPEARHAMGLLAVCFALNGEVATAEAHLEGPVEAPSGSVVDVEFWETPPRLAAFLILSHQGRYTPTGRSPQDERSPTTSTIRRAYAAYESVLDHLSARDYVGAAAFCETYRGRLDYAEAPKLLEHLLLGLEAFALLQGGRPGKVLSLLRLKESPEGHFVCYEMLVATALSVLGSPQRALDVLAPCLAMDSRHSGATRPSVLLGRSIAFALLGDSDQADFSFARAKAIADREGLVPVLIGLQQQPLGSLNAQLAAEGVKARAPKDPKVRGSGELSDSELELAEKMATGKTFPQLAADSFHSASTLKTQASSIYRKLGVKTREDALDVLRSAGFFT